VEPEVLRLGDVEGQVVVLAIPLADEDLEAQDLFAAEGTSSTRQT
jgi:hypothetical protein